MFDHRDDYIPSNDWVDFGYQNVLRTQKTLMVRNIFNRVANKYNLMNDVMSLGIHRLWKRYLVSKIVPTPAQKLLDVAAGTGDISYLFMQSNGGHATLIDLAVDMLNIAKYRLINAGIVDYSIIVSQAEKLPLDDRSFDVYTISFGLRNATDRMTALSEAYRVLKPGARFYCLEFSPRILPALQKAYDVYSNHVLPFLGKWIAKDRDSYLYLIESIRRFRDPILLRTDIQSIGFRCVNITYLSGGIVCIHQGIRP